MRGLWMILFVLVVVSLFAAWLDWFLGTAL